MEDDDLLDDEIIDDGDDEYIIIEYEDDVVTEDYDGHQVTVERGYLPGIGVDESSRSYTQIANGVITFGYRGTNNGTRTPRYTLTPASYTSGSTTYYGLSCSAERIKIAQDDTRSNLKLVTQVYNTYGATGYLQVITDITVSQNNGVFWTVERLPFQNGLCVVNR